MKKAKRIPRIVQQNCRRSKYLISCSTIRVSGHLLTHTVYWGNLPWISTMTYGHILRHTALSQRSREEGMGTLFRKDFV